MRALPWIVGGGIAVYAWSRRASHAPKGQAPFAGPLPGKWVWPVPRWNGRAPVITDGFDSPRPGLPRHGGVDIMFARVPTDPYKAGTPNGSKLAVMPDGLVAVAASDGVVWSATQTPQGFAVVIDHGPNKVATYNPGLTYERTSVEVAVRLTSPSNALDEEMRLIARLKPRDNQIGQPEAAEAVPF